MHTINRKVRKNRNPSITFNSSKSTYNVKFDQKTIETTVTDKSSVVDQWVRYINVIYGGSPMVVGLDVEWRPNRIRNMNNKSATLQLCIDTKCLIIQLFYINKLPSSLLEFCGSQNFTFVGVEVGGDIAKLKNDYGLECKRSADIREVAKRHWPGRFCTPRLKDLASDVAGIYMEKPKHICMSNWEARVLSESQIEYACIDAYASYKIEHKLIIEN